MPNAAFNSIKRDRFFSPDVYNILINIVLVWVKHFLIRFIRLFRSLGQLEHCRAGLVDSDLTKSDCNSDETNCNRFVYYLEGLKFDQHFGLPATLPPPESLVDNQRNIHSRSTIVAGCRP